MNLRQLDVFRSIMSEGSTVSAANKLGTSQPAVSKLLKEIEDAIGIALFERSGGRLLPTPEARSLYELVDRMEVGLNLINRFIGDLREARRGRLSLAAMPLMLNKQIPDLIASFLIDHPAVDVTLQSHNIPRMYHSVAIGDVDVAIDIARSDHADVKAEQLIDLELACVVPVGHRLSTQSVVTEQDLSYEKLISLNNSDGFPMLYEGNSMNNRTIFARRITVYQAVLAFELISRGVGVGLVDRLTIKDLWHPGLVVIPYRPRVSFDVSIMTSSRWPSSTLTKAFIAFTKKHFENLKASMEL